MVNAIINRPIFIHRYVIGHCNKMWSIVTKGYYNLYMRLIMDFLLIFLFNWYVLYWCKNKITYTFNYILFLYHYFTILVFKISLQLSFLYQSCIPIKLFFFFLIFVGNLLVGIRNWKAKNSTPLLGWKTKAWDHETLPRK
jgi:hypothetical protein